MIAVEAPTGGWNVAGLVDDTEKVAVAYPPSPIDRGAQKYRTLIRGHLAGVNNDKPHRLIVKFLGRPLRSRSGRIPILHPVNRRRPTAWHRRVRAARSVLARTRQFHD